MRVNLSSVLEISRYLSTKAGSELKDFIESVSTLQDQFVRVLNKGITFQDNFQAIVKIVSLPQDQEKVISDEGKLINGIICMRVSDFAMIDSLGWHYNSSGELIVRASFSNTTTDTINATLLMTY